MEINIFKNFSNKNSSNLRVQNLYTQIDQLLFPAINTPIDEPLCMVWTALRILLLLLSGKK